ncbi:MAG: hypothetical protein IIB73_02345 [Proteobacteria bacterium]|nr:hypothetical protein [Pseudomonadota bacterium]
MAQDQNVPGDQASQIAAVLEYRYGDGLVYLPRNHPRLFIHCPGKTALSMQGAI